MERLTTHLTLAPGASIDLHMHTNYSDGRWPAQQLIDFLVAEGFDLVAVTDHDRVDMVEGMLYYPRWQLLPCPCLPAAGEPGSDQFMSPV